MNVNKLIDVERIIHAVKTLIACLVGYAITYLAGPHNIGGPWIVITVLIIMTAQIYVGSVLQKSYLRFLGTLLGCFFSSIALVTYGATTVTAIVTLSLSSFIFSYLATSKESLDYAGTLGAATTAIIMLSPAPSLTIAIYRTLEISLGILIAAFVSQFILPIHARENLRKSQLNTLKQLRDYYTDSLINYINAETAYLQNLEETIAKSLIKQRQLALEAKRELLDKQHDPAHFLQTLYCEKEMLRSIDFMHHAIVRINQTNAFFSKTSPLFAFNDAILLAFKTLILGVEQKIDVQTLVVIPSLDQLKNGLRQMSLTLDELTYLNGFVLSAERLTNCFTKLSVLFNIPHNTTNTA